MPITIVVAILAAIIFAASGYLKSSGTENFETPKFVATIAVGAIVGAFMYVSGSPVTEANVATQIGIYAGVVAVVENVLKAILRRF